MKRALLPLCAAALVACASEDTSSPGAASGRPRPIVSAPAPETPESPDTPEAPDTPETPEAPEGEGITLLTAVDTLGFTRSDAPGIAPGFDLDGRVSDTADATTCRKPDFTSPDGEPGVDNQLATLVPLFETVGIGAVEGLVQDSIEQGGLLIMLELADLHDLENDAQVTARLRLGSGTPLLGTDGLLLSGQTFDVHPASQDVVVENARVVDGVFEGGPLEAVLPIVVFGVEYSLPIHNAHLRARLTYDGGLVDGLLGGEVVIEDILTIASRANNNDQSILPAVRVVLNGRGDLDPDENGLCRRISGTFDFTAVSAYFF